MKYLTLDQNLMKKIGVILCFIYAFLALKPKNTTLSELYFMKNMTKYLRYLNSKMKIFKFEGDLKILKHLNLSIFRQPN